MDSTALLLELSAGDDLAAFRRAIEDGNLSPTATAPWYSRSTVSGLMGLELRSPLHIAALYNSTTILNYILSNSSVDTTLACGSDAATPLHCAAAAGAVDAAKLLLAAGASPDSLDASGRRPADLIPRLSPRSLAFSFKSGSSAAVADLTFPDIKSGIYSSDEFRMYSFKVKPCSRAYSHDWTECPFAHPGENARRRDPLKFVYSCVPCPEFRKTSACRSGDSCEYAHGVFESWLHPAQYRTRLCKDEVGCSRRVCFFAHRVDELRTVNPAAAAMAMPASPRLSYSDMAAALTMMQPGSPAGRTLKNVELTMMQPGSPAGRTLKNVELDLNSMRLGLGPTGYNSPRSSTRLSTIAEVAAATAAAQYYGANMNQSSSMRMDNSTANAIVNSRSIAFAKRSQSFIDRRGAINMAATPGWGSPSGKADWGAREEELSKLRRSASFGLWGGFPAASQGLEEPDVSWVHSLVREEQMVA